MHPNETDVDLLNRRTKELDESEALDRVLIGYSSIWPHNHAYAPHMLSMSQRLSLIVAHRPGVMDPAAAARYFSTLDVVSRGRLAINLVIGGSDKDLHREGDYTAKAIRYERANEYLDVMRQAWTDPASFDHEGTYYKEEHVKQLVHPVCGQVPIYMGGDSDEAVDFGARHADMYMLWGEPLAMRTDLDALDNAYYQGPPPPVPVPRGAGRATAPDARTGRAAGGRDGLVLRPTRAHGRSA